MRCRIKGRAVWSAFVVCVLVSAPGTAQTPAATGATKIAEAGVYGRLSLSFEPNQGQTNPEVKFLARGPGYGLFLTRNEMVLALRQPRSGSRETTQTGKESVLRMEFIGANAASYAVGERQLPGKSNYFFGKDPAKWQRDIPQFSGVRYRNVYRGVDVVYYGNQRQLEYDFVVAPGANPRAIRLRFGGASSLKINPAGDLVLGVGGQVVTMRAPLVYQEIDGARRTVEGRFVVRNARDITFDIGRYDRSKVLVIDPKVVYSTYLGGSDHESGWGAVDPGGYVYLTGATYSPDFPRTGQLNEPGSSNPKAFVAKLSADGQSLVYSTFMDLGGQCFSLVAADSQGRVHLLLNGTGVSDVPLVNPVQSTCDTRGFGGYMLTLGPAGDEVVQATHLCGSIAEPQTGQDGYWTAIATDTAGNTYLTGFTRDPSFPPPVNAFQSSRADSDRNMADAFVIKLTSGGDWVYSTFLGGSSWDGASSIAADAEGNAYVVGGTYSDNFPTVNAAQPLRALPPDNYNGSDGFIAKIAPDGSALLYSTYWGGSQHDGMAKVAVNAEGTAWVAGDTRSPDFPVSPGRPSPTYLSDAYPGILVCLDPGGVVQYSTAVHLNTQGIALDSADNIYLASQGSSFRWPLVDPLMSAFTDPSVANVIVEKLDPTATTVLFSTIWGGPSRPRPEPPQQFGGVREDVTGFGVDGAGNIHVVGYTTNDDFPIVNAFQAVPGGYPPPTDESQYFYYNLDLFVVKISQDDNTPAGSNVAVAPANGTTIVFDSITSPGTTSFAKLATVPGSAVPPSADFRLGDPPAYYEISTTAEYAGPITICLDYSKISFSAEWGLGLYHYENGGWVDITTSVDVANNRICGVAPSLSPFAILGAPLPPIEVVGFAPPLAPLVTQGNPVQWPDKAFKLGRTLPLRLELLADGQPLTDQAVQPPRVVELRRTGETPLNLDTLDLDSGGANDHGLAFRFSDGAWVYNLRTQGLAAGSYVITIQRWDGQRHSAGFVLKQ